jgi:hypothetical protein
VWMITTALTLDPASWDWPSICPAGCYAKQRAQDIAAEAARAGGQQLQGAAADTRTGRRRRPRELPSSAANTYIAGAPGSHRQRHDRKAAPASSPTPAPPTQTKFLSIIGISTLTVTGHAEVQVNRAVSWSRPMRTRTRLDRPAGHPDPARPS